MLARDTVSGLTPAQEVFAREVASGKTRSGAYRVAYPSSQKWKASTVHQQACRAAAHPKVSARILALREELQREFRYGRSDAFREAHEAYLRAVDRRDPSAMIAAVTLKARISGLLPHRPASSPFASLPGTTHRSQLLLDFLRQFIT